jgi:hypothetical protein
MVNLNDQNGMDNSSTELAGQAIPSPEPEVRIYEIYVKGHLNRDWSDWLDGLEMKFLDRGEMILAGPIADQAALMGVLNKLVRLNLTLLSINEIKKADRPAGSHPK